jgi:hypothetical protein
LSEAVNELGLDLEYAMALIYPTRNPEDMADRYNAVLKIPAYAKTVTVSQMSDDKNFVLTGDKVVMSDGLKKEAALRIPYGELPNRDRGAAAKTNAGEIIRILGGGLEAVAFVNQLGIGLLNDKEFIKGFIKIISKGSREAIKLTASDIYRSKDLADKINGIYNDSTKVTNDKISGVRDLITAISQEKAKAVSAAAKSPAAVIKNCAEAAVETLGKIILLKALTEEAVRLNPFAQDMLKVAGLTESLDKATTMGEVRAKTGFEYRTVARAEIATLETPFVAYIANKGTNTGHVITVTKVSEGKITYSDNEVSGAEMTIDKLYEMGFEELVLVSPESKGGVKVESLKGNIEKILGKEVYEKLSAEGKEFVSEIINGVTRPQDIETTLSALLAVCKDAKAIAAVLDISISEVKEKGTEEAIKEINSKYYRQISRVMAIEGTSGADKQVSVKLLAMARDLMFMVIKNPQSETMLDSESLKVEEIMPMLVISKAVNQNVIVDVSGTSVLKADSGDFVIDIEKLQKVVKEKISITDAKKALEDLSAMLESNGRGSAAMPMSLTKLSDIKAVAQAA